MAQIVVAEVEAYDPAIYGTRTLRFATQGFVAGGTPIADPTIDSRLTITRAGTATRFNRSGLVESVAANTGRIDYDPTTKALRGLLIEESRQNVLTYSEQCWDTAVWGVGSTLANFYTVTNSTDVANIYGGSAGVAKFVATASTAVLFLRKTLTLAAGTYAPSIFVDVPSQAGVSNWSIVVDAADVEQTTAFVSTVFDRWVRATVPVLTTAASRAFWDFNIFVNGSTPTTGFTFYAMGPQIEAGPFHTSYIPTTTAAVTRNADRIHMEGTRFSAWYNATAGTLFGEATSFHSVNTTGYARRFAEVSDGTTANRMIVDVSPLGVNRGIAIAASTTVLDGIDDTYTTNAVSRVALAYASGDYASVSNGRTPVTSASAAVASGVDKLSLGSQHDTANSFLNGHLRRVIYWPTRLSNAQLQAVTAGGSTPSGMVLDLNFVDGAHAVFDGRIYQPANVLRECFAGSRTFGKTQIGYGDMVLVNNDGGLDHLLGYFFAGRRISIYLGDVAPNNRGVPTWTTVLRGTMEQVELSWQRVTVRVRDRQLDLAKPVQQTRYAGTGGMEGNSELDGRPKPLIFGKVFNIAPPMVDTTRNIFQIHSGGQVVSVDGVFDRGVALTAGSAYTSLADIQANAPAAGQYRVWNDATAGCFIRVAVSGSGPTGTVTVDATQGSSRTVGDLFNAILLTSGISSSEISSADVAALNAAVSYEVGVYAGHEHDTSVITLLDELCASVGAWYGADALGVFRVGRIEVPTGASVGTITATEVIEIERIASRDPGVGVPAWKIKVAHRKTQFVQMDLAEGVTNDRRQFASSDYRRATAQDTAVKTASLISPEIEFKTVLTQKADASAEASRLLTMYKTRRDVYQLTVRVDATLAAALDLGRIVTLQINRFGMSAGKKFLIIGIRTNMRGYQFDLTLWG